MNPRTVWHPRRLPDLRGQSYLVTGATAGLGYFSCEQLLRAGADVIMTGRNPHRLAAARVAAQGRTQDADHPGTLETLLLDTSNLGSVRAAAATVTQRGRLNGLLLNAGIVRPPRHRAQTKDGNELVLATNVLGHYALAGALLRTLAAGRGRMVWLGSISTIAPPSRHPADFHLVEGYSPWRAYVQSKIATTALGFEAERRLRDARVPVASVVAHPGYAISGRTQGIQGVNEPTRLKRFRDNLQAPVTQSKEQGAWSLVRALVDPAVSGGEFWGPSRMLSGAPKRMQAPGYTRDPALGTRLWELCEQATQLPWPFLQASR